MIEQPNNQTIPEAPKSALTDRVDQFYAEKNDWKKLNGGCPISADIDATLQLLQMKLHPTTENVPGMVRASVLNYAVGGQTFEQIWADKLAEGANFVGVVDGVFGFYRGEEKLKTNNKPLQISAMPVVLEFREREKELIKDRAKIARQSLMANLRAEMQTGAAPVSETPQASPDLNITEGQL